MLPYATTVSAPIIKTDDIVAWKARGIHNVNKEFENKFNELKFQYEKLMEEFELNEMVYNAKFSFEPVIGEIYHLYQGNDGNNFLSLIGPNEWNKEHIATFKLNSERKWVALKQHDDFFM
jgi:predicted nucleotide-binding protein (sugar kinase/HSP70/actin superfamily)